MKNRVLLETRVRLVMADEAETVIDENQELFADLYNSNKPSGCSVRTLLLVVLALVNVGMYFGLKKVSPGYIIPKMILGNVVAVILMFLTVSIILTIIFRRKRRKEQMTDDDTEDLVQISNGEYVIVKNLSDFEKPKLTLRELNFTYMGRTYEWTDIKGYTNTDEWLFVMSKNTSIIPIKMDNLKEKRRMEIIGIFADRIRRAKATQQLDKAIE